MIPILTQNIKLILLHQSSKDLIRAEDIGKCFTQYFQDKPNLIIGLQENFWKKGYSTIQRNLPTYVYCSKILNENGKKKMHAFFQGCEKKRATFAFSF